MKTYTLESKNIQDMETFYNEISKVFNFPAHFGRNLDALSDCLREFDGDILVLSGFDGFEEKLWEENLGVLMEIFSDAGLEVVLEYGF